VEHQTTFLCLLLANPPPPLPAVPKDRQCLITVGMRPCYCEPAVRVDPLPSLLHAVNDIKTIASEWPSMECVVLAPPWSVWYLHLHGVWGTCTSMECGVLAPPWSVWYLHLLGVCGTCTSMECGVLAPPWSVGYLHLLGVWGTCTSLECVVLAPPWSVGYLHLHAVCAAPNNTSTSEFMCHI
jgi:hypothetical protein